MGAWWFLASVVPLAICQTWTPCAAATGSETVAHSIRPDDGVLTLGTHSPTPSLTDDGSGTTDSTGQLYWHVSGVTYEIAFIEDLAAVAISGGHGDLSGLADDDHPQYAEIAAAETITGAWLWQQYLDLEEISAPAAPSANRLRLSVQDEGGFEVLHWRISSGPEFELGDVPHVVRNASGATLPKGKMVYITGSNGVYPTVALAKADSRSTAEAYGMVVADISNNDFGLVLEHGELGGMDTSAFSDGDLLYLSDTTAGDVTTTRPTAPNWTVEIGRVIKGGSVGAGIIEVESHDPAPGDSTPENIKANLSASSAPTTSNDDSQGYEPGSLWLDTTNDEVYICADASTGAAVWKQVASGGGGSGIEVVTVANINDPSAELNARSESTDGVTILCVQVAAERATFYTWYAAAVTESVPYTVDGSSGHYQATTGYRNESPLFNSLSIQNSVVEVLLNSAGISLASGKTITIGGVGLNSAAISTDARGTSNTRIMTEGAADAHYGAFQYSMLHVQHQETSGTRAGTLTAGARRTRPLNTVLTNEIFGASLASNQITLPAGTYLVIAWAAHRQVNRTQLYLYDETGAADLLVGSTGWSSSANSEQGVDIVTGRFTIASESDLELEHECTTTRANDGMGEAAGVSFTVPHEVYADVMIWKVA